VIWLVIFVALWGWLYHGLKNRKISVLARIRGEDTKNMRTYYDYGPPGTPILLVSLEAAFAITILVFVGYVLLSSIFGPF
jgi:hypothetical protein